MSKLQSVTITATPDSDPPLDYLGEYRGKPGDDERTVDRAERGHKGRGELRYFVAADADAREMLYERAERFARGELAAYGIRAEATVEIGGTRQTIRSGGIWGIESDAGQNHADTYAREELSELVAVLEEIGLASGEATTAEWAADAPWSGTVSVDN